MRAEAKDNGSVGQPETIDFDELTDLIRMVNDSDIVDFEIENRGVSLSIKKSEALEEKAQVVQGPVMSSPPIPSYPMPPPPVPDAPPPQVSSPAAAAPAPKKEEKAVPDGLQIVSPMSGCFYSAPAPGEPAFVKEGDKVSSGQTVCIIEAMKLMNEIEAEISGEVIKILAQNGQSITAGEALMIVKPV